MAILLNDDELFAMRGLQYGAVMLYFAIRQAMDMATGMVGVRSLISWQALRESLYVEPGPSRRDSGSPHESALRRWAFHLEKAGLLKNCSNSTNRQLIFKCIKATHDKSAQNKADRQADRPPRSAKPIPARVLNFPKREADRQADTHPSLTYLYDIQSSSSHVANDDDDIQPKSENQKPLLYPPRTEDWHQRMATMLRNIPQGDAQMLLDELAGQMRAGRVERPLGYFNRMIENYLRGDFRGELATGEKAIRERREAEQAARLEEKSKPAFQKNPEAFSEARAKLVELGLVKP